MAEPSMAAWVAEQDEQAREIVRALMTGEDIVRIAEQMGLSIREFGDRVLSGRVLDLVDQLDRIARLQVQAMLARHRTGLIMRLCDVAFDPATPPETVRRACNNLLHCAETLSREERGGGPGSTWELRQAVDFVARCVGQTSETDGTTDLAPPDEAAAPETDGHDAPAAATPADPVPAPRADEPVHSPHEPALLPAARADAQRRPDPHRPAARQHPRPVPRRRRDVPAAADVPGPQMRGARADRARLRTQRPDPRGLGGRRRFRGRGRFGWWGWFEGSGSRACGGRRRPDGRRQLGPHPLGLDRVAGGGRLRPARPAEPGGPQPPARAAAARSRVRPHHPRHDRAADRGDGVSTAVDPVLALDGQSGSAVHSRGPPDPG